MMYKKTKRETYKRENVNNGRDLSQKKTSRISSKGERNDTEN